MTTVASLQIKIGADVSAAINGLSRSEYAAVRTAESFNKAAENAQQYGNLATIAGQRVAAAATGAQNILNRVNFDKITQGSEQTFNRIQKVIDLTANAGNAATLIGAGFVKAQQIGNVALTALGAAIPALGLKIAAFAGPIGLALGAVGALVGGFISLKTAQDNTIDSQRELNRQINDEISNMGAMLAVLRSNNLSYNARGELIDKVNSKYGTTLKNIKDETQFTEQLDRAYQDLATSIKNKIIIDSQQDAIKNIVSDIIKLEGSIAGLKEQSATGPGILAGLGATPGQIAAQTKTTTGLIEGFTNSLNEKQTQLQKATAKIADLFNGVIFGGKNNGAGKKNINEISEAYKDLENNLTGIQTKLNQNLIKPLDAENLKIDAFNSAISRLLQIDPTGEAAQKAIDRYKNLFDRSPLEIPALIIPTVTALENKGAGNAASKAIADINAAFEKQKVQIKLSALPDGISGLDKFIDKYIGKVNQAIAFTGQIGAQLLNIANLAGNYENRLTALEDYYSKEADYIENSVAADSVKTARKKALEDELAKKRKQLLKDQAQQQKVSSLFNAIINTAQAVTKALAEGGPAYALAVGALGAVEVALIAGAQVPALASGGLVSGPNTVLVGEYPGASRNPELISPVDKVQKYISEAVTASTSFASEIVGVLRNDDLYLMIKRGEYRKFRTG